MYSSVKSAKKQWNKTPCGIGNYLEEFEEETLEWFEQIYYSRYEVTDKWIIDSIDFEQGRDKKLLEIGHGIGTDLVRWAEHGAEVHGIDITEKHHNLTKKNFMLRGLQCDLKLCSALSIDYPDGYFDVVYSNGVIHHISDPISVSDEILRVLKPGGKIILAVYNTHSAYHYCILLLLNGLIRGRIFSLGYKGLLATIEYGADGINTKPYVSLWSKSYSRNILKKFNNIQIKVAHFDRKHLFLIWRLIPKQLEKLLEKYLGWYLVVTAIKPNE